MTSDADYRDSTATRVGWARLADIPNLVRRLERYATALRQWRTELERALAQAGARPVAGADAKHFGNAAAALAERARGAQEDLEQACQRLDLRLAAVLSALETIRLDLLRVRAGLVVPEDLTADLQLAEQIGRDVEGLLQGRAEVAGVLGETGRRSQADPPTCGHWRYGPSVPHGGLVSAPLHCGASAS